MKILRVPEKSPLGTNFLFSKNFTWVLEVQTSLKWSGCSISSASFPLTLPTVHRHIVLFSVLNICGLLSLGKVLGFSPYTIIMYKKSFFIHRFPVFPATALLIAIEGKMISRLNLYSNIPETYFSTLTARKRIKFLFWAKNMLKYKISLRNSTAKS